MEPQNSVNSQHQNSSAVPSAPQPQKKGFWNSLRELIQFSALVLIVVLPIRFFIVEPFIVNGASMDPTFSTGQFLMVDRLSYNFEDPDRGDVVVFKYPNNPKIYYIKRVIGLPNETVSIKNGAVTISGANHEEPFELVEPYISALHASADTLTVTLKEDEYFVMGDNRAQSSDSRIWGPLEEKFIVGRPIIRLFPITTLSVFPGEHVSEQTN